MDFVYSILNGIDTIIRFLWFGFLLLVSTCWGVIDKDMGEFLKRTTYAVRDRDYLYYDPDWWMTKLVRDHENRTGKEVKGACQFFWLTIYYIPLTKVFGAKTGTYLAVALPFTAVYALFLYWITHNPFVSLGAAIGLVLALAITKVIPNPKNKINLEEETKPNRFSDYIDQIKGVSFKEWLGISLKYPLSALLFVFLLVLLVIPVLIYFWITEDNYCPVLKPQSKP